MKNKYIYLSKICKIFFYCRRNFFSNLSQIFGKISKSDWDRQRDKEFDVKKKNKEFEQNIMIEF